MKIKFWTNPLVLLVSILVFSCTPEDGEDGETGPKGPQGEQGIQGEPGTANVIYSDWIPTELEPSTFGIVNFDINAPELDLDILNFGTILVYGSFLNSESQLTVFQLPVVFGGSTNQQFSYVLTEGNINIRASALEAGEGVPDADIFEQYRYVLIPGGANTSGKSSVDYTKMSYEEVIDLLNIPE